MHQPKRPPLSDAERRVILARIVQVILEDPGRQGQTDNEQKNTDVKEEATR